jgi:hypothetical protein
MKRRIPLFCIAALALALASVSLVSAAPRAPGTPTLRWVTTGATTAEIRADGITTGGTAGNGAIAWDIYFRYPATVSPPFPTVSITPGSGWTGMSPCTFATNVSNGMPSGPNATGTAGILINGFCTTAIPTNPVTGSNVLVATVTLSGCPTAVAGFVMDLDSGDDVYGVPVAGMVDRANDTYVFSDSSLTDGAPLCVPTAITLASFSAVAQLDHVLLTWETVSELNNAGFNLYRDTSPVGPGVQVNSALIASQGPGGTGGFSYSWQDFDAPTSTSLYYWLESVDFNGSTSRYGPVSVEPVAPTAVGLNSFAAQATAPGWPLWPAGLAALASVTLTVRRLKRSRRAER